MATINYISKLKFKKNAVSIALLFIKGLAMIKEILRFFFLWLDYKPGRAIGRPLFKISVVPLYKLYLLLQKQAGSMQKIWRTDARGDKRKINFSRALPHGTIVILAILIVFQNVQSREVAAQDFGTQSIMFSLIQESEELIIEQGEDSRRTQQANINSPGQTQNFVRQLNTLDDEPVFDSLGQEATTLAEGASALVKQNISETLSGGRPRGKTIEYIVEPGDTISGIAEKFNISVNTILWENKLSSRSLIRPGDDLTILPTTGVAHKVKSGETLASIAKKYDTDVGKIASFNNIADAAYLVAGNEIIVPGGSIKSAAPARTQLASFKSIFIPSSSKVSASGFIWPIGTRRITQYFSWRHRALDVSGSMGIPIFASAAGRVEKSGWGSGYGNHVIVNHGGGQKTLYAHLSQLYVTAGEQVEQGETIGANGSTGWSTGPHVHFEIVINGQKVNPLLYL